MDDIAQFKNRTVSVGLDVDGALVIKIHAGDKYENRVLCEDLITRLESGERIHLEINGDFKRDNG